MTPCIMQPLRFLHLPKTAGTTFTVLLERQYGSRRQFQFSGDGQHDRERFRAIPEAEKRKIVLFTGHASLVTGIPEADRAKIITILRNPVSRVKSFCHHVAEGKSPHLREAFPPESFDLDSFLVSGNPELYNLQTRILIETPETEKDPFATISPSDALQLARHNLSNRVFCFGLRTFR